MPGMNVVEEMVLGGRMGFAGKFLLVQTPRCWEVWIGIGSSKILLGCGQTAQKAKHNANALLNGLSVTMMIGEGWVEIQ